MAVQRDYRRARRVPRRENHLAAGQARPFGLEADQRLFACTTAIRAAGLCSGRKSEGVSVHRVYDEGASLRAARLSPRGRLTASVRTAPSELDATAAAGERRRDAA